MSLISWIDKCRYEYDVSPRIEFTTGHSGRLRCEVGRGYCWGHAYTDDNNHVHVNTSVYHMTFRNAPIDVPTWFCTECIDEAVEMCPDQFVNLNSYLRTTPAVMAELRRQRGKRKEIVSAYRE